MNTLPNSVSTVPKELHPPLKQFTAAIGSPVRWQMLAELGAGEPLMVKELAQRLKISASLASKHVAVLRVAGLVVVGRAGVYLIPPHFPQNAEARQVDFGHGVLRLAAGA